MVVLLIGAVGVGVLYWVVDGIDATAQHADEIAAEARVAARRAEDAAAIAVLNNVRIDKAALAACRRAERVKDGLNRKGAIIYLVLSRAAKGSGRVTVQARKSYRSLARLPLFHPRTDCDRAATDPDYVEDPAVPFAELPHWKVRQALRQGR